MEIFSCSYWLDFVYFHIASLAARHFFDGSWLWYIWYRMGDGEYTALGVYIDWESIYPSICLFIFLFCFLSISLPI